MACYTSFLFQTNHLDTFQFILFIYPSRLTGQIFRIFLFVYPVQKVIQWLTGTQILYENEKIHHRNSGYKLAGTPKEYHVY